MNPFGASVSRFLRDRGFLYRGKFRKFLQETSLLVSVAFDPVRNAFDAKKPLGYSIAIEVFYPLTSGFFLVSPGELGNLRRDGTLRHFGYINEGSAIFQKDEAATMQRLLIEYFDYWYEKLTEPPLALSTLSALRTRAPFPSFVKYLEEFVATTHEAKMEFARRQIAPVVLFDGGINFQAFVAYLNAAGRFAEAIEMIEGALAGNYFEGVPHVRVTMNETLAKLLTDAREQNVSLSQHNRDSLDRYGLSVS